MRTTLLVAIATQLVLLLGEVPAAGYLSKTGFMAVNLFHPWFVLFTFTRLLGIMGQIYLLSAIDAGKVTTIMGICGMILSNILGVFILHQKALSTEGYIGLFLSAVSMILLTAAK